MLVRLRLASGHGDLARRGIRIERVTGLRACASGTGRCRLHEPPPSSYGVNHYQ